MGERVIFFDGACGFCSFWVRFVDRRVPEGRFRFEPLESPEGREACRAAGIPEGSPRSAVLKEGDRYYTRSTAALRIFKGMSGFWPLLYLFVLVPAPIRHGIYRLIANLRHRNKTP